MIKLDDKLLKELLPQSTRDNRVKYLPYLVELLPKYGIDSWERIAAFISNVGVESLHLKYCEEIASGQAYEGREDLGNTQKGDGVRYKGRGLIQVTGRDNYKKVGKDLGVDFISNPQLLSTPRYAVESACWYWKTKKLNELC